MISCDILTAVLLPAPLFDDAVPDLTATGLPVEFRQVVVADGSEADRQAFRDAHPGLTILDGRGVSASDAYNQAIDASDGDYIVFVNADDRLQIPGLAAFAERAAADPETEIWSGGVRFFETVEGRERTLAKATRREDLELSLANILDSVPLWNGRIYRRSLIDRAGVLTDRHILCSDREFLLRMKIAGAKTGLLEALLYEYRYHEGSWSIRDMGREVPPYLEAHMDLARDYTRRATTEPETRKFLKRWYGREAFRLIYHASRNGQLWRAVKTAVRAFGFRPLWWLDAPAAVSVTRRRRKSGGAAPPC